MDVVRKTLDIATTINYLADTLSQIEVTRIDVTRALCGGSVCTFAPNYALDDRLYDFKHGGLMPPPNHSVAKRSTVQPVSNTAGSLARELAQFNGLECLIHDPLKKIDEVSKTDGEPILIENSLFYLNRDCFLSIAKCQEIIRRNTLSWHFLLFAGKYPTPKNLSRQSIVLNATCIVVGAYDGESYLVWRAN